MPESLHIGSVEEAERLLFSIDAFDIEILKGLKLGEWVKTHVYIPHGGGNSEITSAYMEAFLELQRSIYLMAAFAEHDVASTRLLTDEQRSKYQLSVHVSGGSSNLNVNVTKSLEGVLKVLLDKVDGRQATIIVVTAGLLLAGGWFFTAWLDSEKQVRLATIRSQEHIDALRALSLSNEQSNQNFQRLLNLLKSQGRAGEVVLSALLTQFEALLKAASKVEVSETNGQLLSQGQAALLRSPLRRIPTTRTVVQKVRVVDLNTVDPLRNVIILQESSSREQLRMPLPTNLFTNGDRKKLIDSLDTGEEIWVEIFIREIDGEPRSVDFLRVADDPGQ